LARAGRGRGAWTQDVASGHRGTAAANQRCPSSLGATVLDANWT